MTDLNLLGILANLCACTTGNYAPDPIFLDFSELPIKYEKSRGTTGQAENCSSNPTNFNQFTPLK